MIPSFGSKSEEKLDWGIFYITQSNIALYFIFRSHQWRLIPSPKRKWLKSIKLLLESILLILSNTVGVRWRQFRWNLNELIWEGKTTKARVKDDDAWGDPLNLEGENGSLGKLNLVEWSGWGDDWRINLELQWYLVPLSVRGVHLPKIEYNLNIWAQDKTNFCFDWRQ